MYPNLYPVVFNGKRNKRAKVISTLHGMPGYAKAEYIQFRGASQEPAFKKKIRNALIRLGIHDGCKRYCKWHSDSYKTAAEAGERIVLLSPFYMDSFIDQYSLQKHSSKISAIPNPLPYIPGAAPQWEDKENVILFVGRLAMEKRVDIILGLWGRLSRNPVSRSVADSWRLVIVGDGPCRKELESIAQKLGLKRCTFAGKTTEVQKYYSKAKVLLLTSRFEGFPMCLIEAQKFGCIPVSFDICPGVRDILDNGSGVLAKQDDTDDLETKVAELIADDDRLQKMSGIAVSNSERFSIDKVGRMWDNLIESLRQ